MRYARLNCNDCGSRPAGEILSCRDKKVFKETLPGRSPRKRRAVPCAPQAARGLADSASMRCGQRAVPTAPRKISGPDPRRPPVLGELRRGKVNYERQAFVFHFSGCRCLISSLYLD